MRTAVTAAGTRTSAGLAATGIAHTWQTSRAMSSHARSGRLWMSKRKPDYFSGIPVHGNEQNFWSRYPYSSLYARKNTYIKYYCGHCCMRIFKTWDTCHACGQEIDWSHTSNWMGHPLKYTGEALWDYHEREKDEVWEKYRTMESFARVFPELFNEDDIKWKQIRLLIYVTRRLENENH
jgi:hypothetical protein